MHGPGGAANPDAVAGDIAHHYAASADSRPRTDGPLWYHADPHATKNIVIENDVPCQVRTWGKVDKVAYLAIVIDGGVGVDNAAATQAGIRADAGMGHEDRPRLDRGRR